MNLKKLSYLLRIIPLVLLLIAGTTKVKAQYLLNEGFEGTTFPPAGWTNFWAPTSATAYYPWQQIPTAYAYPTLPGPHSGNYAATMYNYGNYTYIDINGTYYYGLSTNELVTPALPLQNYTNGYALISLWIYRYGTNYTNFSNGLMNDDKLSIYVSATPSVTNASTYLGVLSEYTTVGSYFSSTQSVPTAGWYQYSFSIPSSYNSAPAYVIFQDSSNYGFSVNIDDVSVKWIAPCTGMPLSSTITTSALPQPLCSGNTTTIAASDPNTAASMYTYWQSSPTGAPGSWSTIPGTFGPLNVSGGGTSNYTTPALTGSVYYRFADSCAVSSSVAYSSVYAVPVNLYAIPYAEYFNTTPNTQAPTCFTENVTSSGQSHWGTNIVFRDANGTPYPSVISEDDKQGNYSSGKNAYFTLPALALNAGETYRIRFGYERGRSDYLTTNVAPVYPENLYLYENYAVQPSTSGTGIPGGGNATNLFNNVVTVDGHQTASLTFTPPVSGAYFFSWYSNTPHPAGGVLVNGGLIAVDSIKIDSFGCTPPIITFQPQNSAVCLNGTTSLSVNATGYGLTYQWYKNSSLLTGATSSVLTIANAQFADSGSYKVVVTGTCGSTQNVQSNTITLQVSAYPTDSISTTTTTQFCAGGSVVLTANTASGNSYQWQVNGNFIPNAFSPTYTATTAGNYTSVATNPYGCATVSPIVTVKVLTASAVTISPSGPTTFCNGGSVTLTANGVGTNPVLPDSSIHYNWLKDGQSLVPADTTNVLTTSTAGVYTISETLFSNGCSVQFPTPVTVAVNGPTTSPAISAAGPLSFCLGGFVTLSTPTVNQTGYTYQWYQNNNAITGATATTYTASATGQYTVAVSQNNCALSSPIDTVNVDAPPTTVSNNGTIICSGNTIVLTAASGAGLSYQWYGNGTLLTGQTSPTISTDTGGAFQVQVTDAYPCTSISSVTNVTVGAPPSAVLLAVRPTTFCPGDSVIIKANIDPSLTYTWNMSPTGAAGTYAALPLGGPLSDGHNDTIRTFYASGYYTVSEANGPCQGTSLPVHVVVSTLPTPTISSSGSDSLCPGGSVTLTTPTANGYTYQWLKNGANLSGAITPALNVNVADKYAVIATNSTGCVGVSAPVTISSFGNPADSIVIYGNDSICAGSSVVLQAPAGIGYSYQWYLDNSPIPGANNDTFAAGATLGAGTIGNYKVKVTSNVGCAATTPIPTAVHVFAIPPTNVIPSSSTTFCSGNSVTLCAGAGSGLTYQWQSVSGGILTNIPGATGACYTDSVADSFRVVVSNSYCAMASIVIPVTVNTPSPVSISAASATTICDGNSVTLNASATGVGYQWKLNGSPLSPNGTGSSFIATRGGSYTVVVNSSNCISTSPALVVKVNALPKDTVELVPVNTPPLNLTKNNNPTCAGDPAYLMDKNYAAGFTYRWKLNGGNIPVNANGINYGALDSGLYSFTVTDTNGCVGTSPSFIGTTPAYYVGLHALPNPTVIVNGSTLTTGTFASYQWKLNGTDLPGATSNGYTATQSGSYQVEVTDGFGCSKTSDARYVFGVGVSTVNKADIKIFPNPVTSIVHIESPVKVNVTISALDGKKILQGNGVTQVDLSGLSNGVYMITIYDENNAIIKIDKLVKTSW